MSTITTSRVVGSPTAARRHRAAEVGLWFAQLSLAVQFAGGGTLKLIGHPSMIALFDTIGAGDWLRFVVGVLEVAGAVGLVVPRLSGLAAAGLVGLMVGASVTNIAVLHVSPALPLVLLVLAAVVAYARRDRTRQLVNLAIPRA